jgi:hypothetical protein
MAVILQGWAILKNCVRSTATQEPFWCRSFLENLFWEAVPSAQVPAILRFGHSGFWAEREQRGYSWAGTKILRLLLHAIHSHLHHLILLDGFLGLEISTQTAECRWGPGFVYIISLFTFVALFFLLLLFIYI